MAANPTAEEVVEKLREVQAQCPCGGLKFPRLPHLHAADCPNLGADVVFYREIPAERRMFDEASALFGGPLKNVARCLDAWGRIEHGGSYAEQCFVMANECLLAAALLEQLARPVQEPAPPPATASVVEDIERLKALETRLCGVRLGDVMGWVAKGVEAWAGQPHNERWRRKLDGTPIANDVGVSVSNAVFEALSKLAGPRP